MNRWIRFSSLPCVCVRLINGFWCIFGSFIVNVGQTHFCFEFELFSTQMKKYTEPNIFQSFFCFPRALCLIIKVLLVANIVIIAQECLEKVVKIVIDSRENLQPKQRWVLVHWLFTAHPTKIAVFSNWNNKQETEKLVPTCKTLCLFFSGNVYESSGTVLKLLQARRSCLDPIVDFISSSHIRAMS